MLKWFWTIFSLGAPVPKSVKAIVAKSMLVGVLRDVFLKIAVKTSAFPTTATGVKTAVMTEVKMKNVSYFSVI